MSCERESFTSDTLGNLGYVPGDGWNFLARARVWHAWFWVFVFFLFQYHGDWPLRNVVSVVPGWHVVHPLLDFRRVPSELGFGMLAGGHGV